VPNEAGADVPDVRCVRTAALYRSWRDLSVEVTYNCASYAVGWVGGRDDVVMPRRRRVVAMMEVDR
jgi:hypothetical protein